MQKLHPQDGVGDVFAHRTNRVEVLGFDRVNTFDRDQTVSRLQADDAATSGRDANRTGRVRPKSDVRHSACHRHRRARRRPARNQLSIQWISGRSEILVETGGGKGEFAQVRLANDLHVALARNRQASRVLFRRLMRHQETLRPGGRDNALHIDVVFHGEPQMFVLRIGRPVFNEGTVA